MEVVIVNVGGVTTISERPVREPGAATRTLVELRDATAVLGGRTVWSHVDATVGGGEFVAILGHRGVGRSRLLKAILGLVPLAAGDVRLPGNAAIGYLPQRRSFDTSLRIRGVDVVRLGYDGDRWGLPLPGRRSRAATARVRELVELVGAGEYAHRPIGQLSGGEQQRLLIAQALARRPRLLLLDEPLDSLDLPTQSQVAALVADICVSQQVAVMIVAHDVNPILSYLDCVIYFGEGHAVGGEPEAVLTTETLTRLYNTPVEVLRTSDGRLVVVGHPEATSYHPGLHHHAHEAH